jgi:hypothetical protein
MTDKDIHAFPASHRPVGDMHGMTLRDYFAGQWLMGLAARGGCAAPWAAVQAYEVADHMLQAREAK